MSFGSSLIQSDHNLWNMDFLTTVGDLDAFTVEFKLHTHEPRIILCGPSGAGKTLIASSIAGLVSPNRGYIDMNGQSWFNANKNISTPVRQRRIGMVQQYYALFTHLTVRQNIAFGLQKGWLNREPKIVKERIDELIERFELTAQQNNYPDQISGGQAQRTALARALAPDPAILILDEPFSALDVHLRAHLRTELAHYTASLSLPLLMITHDLEDAHFLGGLIIQIEKGQGQYEP